MVYSIYQKEALFIFKSYGHLKESLCPCFFFQFIGFNPKRAGGGIRPPPRDIFCYISAGCYFFALKLHDVFSSSLALDLSPFKIKSDLGL